MLDSLIVQYHLKGHKEFVGHLLYRGRSLDHFSDQPGCSQK